MTEKKPFNSNPGYDLQDLSNISVTGISSSIDKVLKLKKDGEIGKYYLDIADIPSVTDPVLTEIELSNKSSYFKKFVFSGVTNNEYTDLKSFGIVIPKTNGRKKAYITMNIDVYGMSENVESGSKYYNFTTGYNLIGTKSISKISGGGGTGMLTTTTTFPSGPAIEPAAPDCTVCGANPCSAIGEIDLSPMQLSSTPNAMVVANNKLYIAGKYDSPSVVTNQGAVTVIDLSTRKITRLLTIGTTTGPIQSLAYSPETNCVYGVGNQVSGQCHIVIDSSNDTIKTDVPNFLTGTTLRARKVVYNSTNKKLYFLPQLGNVVTTLDTSNNHTKLDITMSQFSTTLNNAIGDMIHIPLSGTFSGGLNEDKMVFTGIYTNGANKQISYILSSDTSNTCNNQTFGVTLNIYGGMTYNPNNKFIYISSGNAYQTTQLQNSFVQILDNSRNLPGSTSLFNYPTSPTGYTTVNTSGITCLNNKVYVTDNNSAVGTVSNAIVVLDSASTQTNATNPLITSGYINNVDYYSSNIISDPNSSTILYSTGTSKASPTTYKLFIFNTSKSVTGSTLGTVDFPSYCSQSTSAGGCCAATTSTSTTSTSTSTSTTSTSTSTSTTSTTSTTTRAPTSTTSTSTSTTSTTTAAPIPCPNEPIVDPAGMTYTYRHIPGSFSIIFTENNNIPKLLSFGSENRHQTFVDPFSVLDNETCVNNNISNILNLQPNFATMMNPIENNKTNIKGYPRLVSSIDTNGNLHLTLQAKSVEYTGEQINWFGSVEMLVTIM